MTWYFFILGSSMYLGGLLYLFRNHGFVPSYDWRDGVALLIAISGLAVTQL